MKGKRFSGFVVVVAILALAGTVLAGGEDPAAFKGLEKGWKGYATVDYGRETVNRLIILTVRAGGNCTVEMGDALANRGQGGAPRRPPVSVQGNLCFIDGKPAIRLSIPKWEGDGELDFVLESEGKLKMRGYELPRGAKVESAILKEK